MQLVDTQIGENTFRGDRTTHANIDSKKINKKEKKKKRGLGRTECDREVVFGE